ncbi:dihydropteroate synthase [Trueperella sp. LYQ143]|uniref:dihydropteroate synthase n=1 Tax=unclassified Trueperella TaxID=2630174 RepID=UPI00398365E6
MKIMGIVNVTPDSFSDGGKFASVDAAIAHAQELLAAGAHVIDIGGESTRPGAQPVDPVEEWRRIGPVVQALAGHCQVSVDTYHSQTAYAAIQAGAAIINDVTGGLGDERMFDVVADSECDYILQHTRSDSRTMAQYAHYGDVVAEVRSELARQRDYAVESGIAPERIILDPGLGFAKDSAQTWEVMRKVADFVGQGHRVLIGQSRKRFLADVTVGDERDVATAVLSIVCAQRGVWAVRVHNVAATVTALQSWKESQ